MTGSPVMNVHTAALITQSKMAKTPMRTLTTVSPLTRFGATSRYRKTEQEQSQNRVFRLLLVRSPTARQHSDNCIEQHDDGAAISLVVPPNHARVITAASMPIHLQLSSRQRRLKLQVVRFVDRLSWVRQR